MTDLEQALKEIEAIVRQLESGDDGLDEALRLFERGQALIKSCQQDLEAKALRIQEIAEDDSDR